MVNIASLRHITGLGHGSSSRSRCIAVPLSSHQTPLAPHRHSFSVSVTLYLPTSAVYCRLPVHFCAFSGQNLLPVVKEKASGGLDFVRFFRDFLRVSD